MKSPLGFVLILVLAFAGCSSEERGRNAAPTSAAYSSESKLTTAQPAAEKAVDATKRCVATSGDTNSLAKAEYEQVSVN